MTPTAADSDSLRVQLSIQGRRFEMPIGVATSTMLMFHVFFLSRWKFHLSEGEQQRAVVAGETEVVSTSPSVITVEAAPEQEGSRSLLDLLAGAGEAEKQLRAVLLSSPAWLRDVFYLRHVAPVVTEQLPSLATLSAGSSASKEASKGGEEGDLSQQIAQWRRWRDRADGSSGDARIADDDGTPVRELTTALLTPSLWMAAPEVIEFDEQKQLWIFKYRTRVTLAEAVAPPPSHPLTPVQAAFLQQLEKKAAASGLVEAERTLNSSPLMMLQCTHLGMLLVFLRRLQAAASPLTPPKFPLRWGELEGEERVAVQHLILHLGIVPLLSFCTQPLGVGRQGSAPPTTAAGQQEEREELPLPVACSTCGTVGHRSDACPFIRA